MVKSPRITTAQKTDIINYLEQGYTLKSISLAVGCHVNTVCRYNKERKAALTPLKGAFDEG